MQYGVIIIKQHDPDCVLRSRRRSMEGVEWKQTTHSFWERTSNPYTVL